MNRASDLFKVFETLETKPPNVDSSSKWTIEL